VEWWKIHKTLLQAIKNASSLIYYPTQRIVPDYAKTTFVRRVSHEGLNSLDVSIKKVLDGIEESNKNLERLAKQFPDKSVDTYVVGMRKEVEKFYGDRKWKDDDPKGLLLKYESCLRSLFQENKVKPDSYQHPVAGTRPALDKPICAEFFSIADEISWPEEPYSVGHHQIEDMSHSSGLSIVDTWIDIAEYLLKSQESWSLGWHRTEVMDRERNFIQECFKTRHSFGFKQGPRYIHYKIPTTDEEEPRLFITTERNGSKISLVRLKG